MRVAALHRADLLLLATMINFPSFLTSASSRITGEEIPALQQALRSLQSEGLPSPCDVAHAPQGQHQRHPSYVRPLQFLQLASWNVRGKSLFQVADVLSDQAIHFDIIALQDVGGLSQGKLTADGFLDADDPAV